MIYDTALHYVKRQGYDVIDSKPDYMVVSRKKLYDEENMPYELWLTLAITGQSLVTVFMDYQLRKAGSEQNGWKDTEGLTHSIDKEYHSLWSALSMSERHT